jgi:hypothetical protein
VNILRHLLWSFIEPVAHNWEAENSSQAASALARRKSELERRRMLMVARSIRVAKGLPET